MKLFALSVAALMLMSNPAVAAVYQWVDEHGVTHFTDEAVDGAKAIKVDKVPTIPFPKPGATDKATPRGDTPAVKSVYSALKVVAPVADQAIRANDGVITVQLSLAPGLNDGHALFISVDGVERPISDLTLTLFNLSRGAHTVSATVKDARGTVLIDAAPVTFFVLRASK